MIKIEVFDTGIGIKENELKNLFELFGKLEDPSQINNEGTGLGLYITNNLLKQMGGSITVESEYNSYTKFTVLLPANALEFGVEDQSEISKSSF